MPADEPEIEVFVPCQSCRQGREGVATNGNGAHSPTTRCRTCGGDGEVIERVPLRLLHAFAASG
jgi:hypothetical protein